MKQASARDLLLSEETLALSEIPCRPRFDAAGEYKNHSLHFAMNAGIAVTGGGRIFSAWIGGEDGPESFLLLSYSDDGGKSFCDFPLILDPHGEELPFALNTHVGGLWVDPKGRLWLFYQQSLGMWDGKGAVFAIRCDEPDAEALVWSEPRYISPGAVIKKPIVRRNGEWILPVSLWERWYISPPFEECHHEVDAIRGATVFASTDEGESWEYRGGVNFTDSCFNEHSVAEQPNGDLLMMSRCMGCMKRSVSSDGGRTWSPEEEYFKHVTGWSSMATLYPLASGNLLLIKHGRSMAHVTEERTHLTALLSRDGGKSFEGGLVLDERLRAAYPDACQAADGSILVQYDYLRKKESKLYFARFTEEDVLRGGTLSPETDAVRLITGQKGPVGTAYTLFDGAAHALTGSGSESDPYRIQCPADLILLSKLVYEGESFAGKCFLQTADLDFEGRSLVPIGAYGRAFCGQYRGGDHVVAHFTVGAYHHTAVGLFGHLKEAVISRVQIKGATVRGKSHVGLLAGITEGSLEKPCVVEHCTAEEDCTVQSYRYGGGLVGCAKEESIFSHSRFDGALIVPRTTEGKKIYAGGIVGAVGNDVLFSHCSTRAAITVRFALDAAVGGIAGGEGTVRLVSCDSAASLHFDTAMGHVYGGDLVGAKNADTILEHCHSQTEITFTRCDHPHKNETALLASDKTYRKE